MEEQIFQAVHLVGRNRTVGPGRGKVVLFHCLSQRGDRGVVVGVIDFEALRAHALTHSLRRTEEPGGVLMVVAVHAKVGDHLEDVG